MLNPAIITTTQLSIGYIHRSRPPKIISADIDLSLNKGELICLLGPNGSGKSTLIRTLAGVQAPLSGNVHLNGKQLGELTRLAIAQQLSLVLTEKIETDVLSVYDVVSLGRMPYTNWIGTLTLTDKQKIEEALQLCGIERYKNRKLSTLSDGEKQKVMIARALAQDTPVIILDEPTAHLDLPSRVAIMRLLRNLTRKTNKSIIASTHELDLALQAADKIWLMDRNGSFYTGVPEDMIIKGIFAAAFKNEGVDFDIQTGNFKINTPYRYSVKLMGNSYPFFWTMKALEREGIKVAADAAIHITIIEVDGAYSWCTLINETSRNNATIEALLITLKEAQ